MTVARFALFLLASSIIGFTLGRLFANLVGQPR